MTGCYRQSYQEDAIKTVRKRTFFVSVCDLQLYDTVRCGTVFSRQKSSSAPYPAYQRWGQDTLGNKHIVLHVMDAEHRQPGLVEMRHLLQGTRCNSLQCPTIRCSIQQRQRKTFLAVSVASIIWRCDTSRCDTMQYDTVRFPSQQKGTL